MLKYFYLTFLVVLAFCQFSCVPHHKTVYFQGEKDYFEDEEFLNQAQRKPYRVQIDDVLSIRVKALDQESVNIFNPLPIQGNNQQVGVQGDQNYYDGFVIDLHGNIKIPVIGEINVLGYNTSEIEALIKKRLLLDQFTEEANLFITVKLGGLQYVTAGEIGSPGTQVLEQEQANIFEAISNSGEIPVTGDMTDVMIVRQYPDGQKIHHLDLTDIHVMNSEFYYIQPNDLIYIKPLRVKTLGTGTTAMQALQSIVTLLSLGTTVFLLLKL